MHRTQLENLLSNNKGRGQFRAETVGGETTIYLYDVIVSDDYFGGVTPLAFAQALAAAGSNDIHLRMNCPGGDVFASVAIAQAVKDHPGKVTVHVDGLAASAATKILVEADASVISRGAMVMIHKSMMFALGNADELIACAGVLVKVDGQIADSYATKTGMTTDEALILMAAETWMTEDEAVAAGFVDAITETNPSKTTNLVGWDLSAYHKPPVAVDPPGEKIETVIDPVADAADIQAHANRLREFELIEGAN